MQDQRLLSFSFSPCNHLQTLLAHPTMGHFCALVSFLFIEEPSGVHLRDSKDQQKVICVLSPSHRRDYKIGLGSEISTGRKWSSWADSTDVAQTKPVRVVSYESTENLSQGWLGSPPGTTSSAGMCRTIRAISCVDMPCEAPKRLPQGRMGTKPPSMQQKESPEMNSHILWICGMWRSWDIFFLNHPNFSPTSPISSLASSHRLNKEAQECPKIRYLFEGDRQNLYVDFSRKKIHSRVPWLKRT